VERAALRLPNPKLNLKQIAAESLWALLATRYLASAAVLEWAILLQVLVVHWERLARVLG